jgi:glutamate-1-semialdehyde 2,1-aminomutase
MAIILNEGYSATDKQKYLAEAKGCTVTDSSGKTYVDMAMAGGSAILGHANEYVRDAVVKQIEKGALFTSPTELAHQYCELLIPHLGELNHFAFSSTGSEATLRAIRIARAYTGKTKIAIFSGGWHGSHDLLMVDDDPESDPHRPTGVLKSAGTPPEVLEQVVMLPYNDEAVFDLIKEQAETLAMVFVEPVQGSNPRDDIKYFLKKLRSTCDKNKVLLGFDEIITGGRLSIAGSKPIFDVTPDIATYGKIYGGGLPIGLVAGKEEVMSCIRSIEPVFLGGTFSGNPLSLAAGKAMLTQLDENPDIFTRLEKSAEVFVSDVNHFAERFKINARMMGKASMFRLVFSSNSIKNRRERDQHEVNAEVQNAFYQTLREAGVWIGTNRINFLSAAHAQKDLDKACEAYKACLNDFHQKAMI